MVHLFGSLSPLRKWASNKHPLQTYRFPQASWLYFGYPNSCMASIPFFQYPPAMWTREQNRVWKQISSFFESSFECWKRHQYICQCIQFPHCHCICSDNATLRCCPSAWITASLPPLLSEPLTHLSYFHHLCSSPLPSGQNKDHFPLVLAFHPIGLCNQWIILTITVMVPSPNRLSILLSIFLRGHSFCNSLVCTTVSTFITRHITARDHIYFLSHGTKQSMQWFTCSFSNLVHCIWCSWYDLLYWWKETQLCDCFTEDLCAVSKGNLACSSHIHSDPTLCFPVVLQHGSI